MKVYCRLLSERLAVLNKLTQLGYKPLGSEKAPNMFSWKYPAHGRVTFVISETTKRLTTIDGGSFKDSISSDEFIKATKAKHPDLDGTIETVLPFKVIGSPIELRPKEWYQEVSSESQFVLDKPIQCIFTGTNAGSFGLIACIKGREKQFIGSPNGSTNGRLYVRVPTPKVVVKLTKSELQKLVMEKFGDNAVLMMV